MNMDMIRSKTAQMIMKYAVPSIIAMVLTTLVTIVDGFFVGNYIGKEGIVAINLGLPILYIFLAVGIMTGVGGVVIAVRLWGGGNAKKGKTVFNQTVVTTLVVSAILSVVFRLSLNPILDAVGLDDGVAEYVMSYYSIMLLAFPIMMVNITLGMFIRGEGKPEVFMMFNMVTVIVNIILDYIFVVELQAGIRSTAYASLISVTIGLLLMASYFIRGSHVFGFEKFRFSKAVLKETCLNGSSELIGQMSMSISMFAYNWVIIREVGVSGVAAFTVIGYSAYLFSMIIIGFGEGASPLLSYSYGAKEYPLTQKIRRITSVFVVVFGCVAVLFMNVTSKSYGELFVKNQEVLELIVSGITIFSISFLFSGVNVISSFFFTSIGRARESAMISASRGLVILLLCIFILPMFFGMTGVWLVAPITEGLTLVMTMIILKKTVLT